MFRLLNGNVMPWNVLWVSEVVSQYWERKMMIKFWRGLFSYVSKVIQRAFYCYDPIYLLVSMRQQKQWIVFKEDTSFGAAQNTDVHPLFIRLRDGDAMEKIGFSAGKIDSIKSLTLVVISVLTTGAGSATDTVEEFLMKT